MATADPTRDERFYSHGNSALPGGDAAFAQGEGDLLQTGGAFLAWVAISGSSAKAW